MSTWETVSAKIGRVHPETLSIARELYDKAKAAGHEIWYIWGLNNEGSGEHKTGLALDLMVHNHAAGQWVRDYIWANRKRLRLHHVIWEQHITSTTVRPGIVVKMEDRGNPTANHRDHVHVLFFAGTYQKPGTTTSTSASTLKRGSSGTAVRRLQQFLLNVFPAYRNSVRYMPGRPLTVDGVFGRQTETWVKEFQRRTGLSQDGVVGKATHSKLKAHGYRY